MPSPIPIKVMLDRERVVRWTDRADARNSSLRRPANFLGLAQPKRRLYHLCALLWAALVDKNHEFDDPEDLAEFFKTEDQQLAGLKALRLMLEEAFPDKQNPNKSESAANGQTSPQPADSLSTGMSSPPPKPTTSDGQ